MFERVAAVLQDGLPWFVVERDGRVVGYAYAARWHKRAAYRRSVEITIYLSHDAQAQGLGSFLYRHLLDELESTSIHTIIGVIALPNPSSVALHAKFGMKKVGHLSEVGYKFGEWVDVGYWEMRMNSVQ